MPALAIETPSTRFVPPAPTPPLHDLSLLRVVLMLRRNILQVWPERAYDEVLLHRRFLGIDCFLVNDPAAIRRVLAERTDNFTRAVTTLRVLRPGTGDGLLLAEGEAWRSQRRLVASHFSPQCLDRLIPAMQAAAVTMVESLPSSGSANLAHAFESAAIDTIGRALFSTPLDARAPRIGGLLRLYFRGAARGSIWDFLARRLDDYAWAMRARRAWSRDWFAEVDAIIAARAGRDAQQPDLFDGLSAGDPAGLRDQVATMLATGFESTARTLFWAAYLLSHDQAEQDAVRDELRCHPPEDATTLEDFRKWPRLANVLNETMRLYPPVSTLMRVAREVDVLKGTRVRAGSLVIVCPWVMHRHRAHWEQPKAFMPERFAGRSDRMRDGTYIPFGMGRRVCVAGAFATTEASLIMAHLLSRWRVSLDDRRPVSPVAIATTVPEHEPHFRLTPVNGG